MEDQVVECSLDVALAQCDVVREYEYVHQERVQLVLLLCSGFLGHQLNLGSLRHGALHSTWLKGYWANGREPRIELPTRICVAPWTIADSKSLLMPADKYFASGYEPLKSL